MKALTHTQVRLLIEKAADGILTAFEQRALESHLQGCAECRAFAAEFASLESALGSALNERWGKPKLSKSSEAKLVKSLQAQFPPSSGGTPKPPSSFPTLPLILGITLVGLLTLGLVWIASGQSPANDATSTSSATPTSTTTVAVGQIFPSSTDTPTDLVLMAIPEKDANCREGNGSVFEIADTLLEGKEYPPTGRGADNLWVRFVGPSFQQTCWAFIDNLVLEINGVATQIEEIPESQLPFVDYPATPTPSPTPSFTPEPDRSETPTPFVPQCSDGIDNDGDRLIDLKDKQCRSANDNDEAN